MTANLSDSLPRAPEPTPPLLPPRSESLPQYAANARWRAETEGMSFRGRRVATDDRSKTLILGSLLKATRDPTWQTTWQCQDGTLELDAMGIAALSDAVGAHVDAVFSIYTSLMEHYAAGELTETSQVDDAFSAYIAPVVPTPRPTNLNQQVTP